MYEWQIIKFILSSFPYKFQNNRKLSFIYRAASASAAAAVEAQRNKDITLQNENKSFLAYKL
jgi:hypothetical protein